MNWKWIMFWEMLNRFQTVAVSTLFIAFYWVQKSNKKHSETG